LYFRLPIAEMPQIRIMERPFLKKLYK